MTNFNDLLKGAKDAGLDVAKVQASGDAFKPAEGETYTVQGVAARSGLTKNGVPQIGVHLEVVDGPDGIGRKFWHNFYFSDNMSSDHKQANALIVDLLGVDGSGAEFTKDGAELPVAPP